MTVKIHYVNRKLTEIDTVAEMLLDIICCPTKIEVLHTVSWN